MEGDVPELSDEEQGSESDGWDELETDKEQTTCLFCSLQFRTIAVALDHCRTEHSFDLLQLKTRFNMDCYSFIKLVNYIRRHKPEPASIQGADMPVWNDDEYLRPLVTESWLMYDFEDLGSTPTTPNNLIDGGSSRTLPAATCTDLQCIITNLTSQLHEKSEALQRALEDMEKMKKLTKSLIENTTIVDGEEKQCRSTERDESYFSTYSHFGIHHEMLSDVVRTEAYREAVRENASCLAGKEVLDLGCGTAILSMFCAREGGAARVWAVDQSDVVYRAMDIVRENGLHEVVSAVRGRPEDGQMPFDKVDVLISEWMGYFLLFEGMLDSVVWARDRYLQPGGLVLPNRCTVSVVASGDEQAHAARISYWSDVYGFRMSCMRTEALREASVELVAADRLISAPAHLVSIDLATCTADAVDFSSDFTLEATRDGCIVSLVGYFDTHFDLPHPVAFSTGPHATPTHWKQTVFYLEEPIPVKQGESVEGRLRCSRLARDARGLRVTLWLRGGPPIHYTLD